MLGACPSLAVIGVAELERFALLKLFTTLGTSEVMDASLDDSLAFLLMCCVVTTPVATAALLLIGPGVLGASLLGTECGATVRTAHSHASQACHRLPGTTKPRTTV